MPTVARKNIKNQGSTNYCGDRPRERDQSLLCLERSKTILCVPSFVRGARLLRQILQAKVPERCLRHIEIGTRHRYSQGSERLQMTAQDAFQVHMRLRT